MFVHPEEHTTLRECTSEFTGSSDRRLFHCSQYFAVFPLVIAENTRGASVRSPLRDARFPFLFTAKRVQNICKTESRLRDENEN